ncbi:hypothetical protein [Saccharopolyspora sp. NPDC049357]|uniref:hypothetical protein n=1 Tax=Saccharopolyspora sp. NPDC049357 TaxID=3154507 RepID=UPI003431F27D
MRVFHAGQLALAERIGVAIRLMSQLRNGVNIEPFCSSRQVPVTLTTAQQAFFGGVQRCDQPLAALR